MARLFVAIRGAGGQGDWLARWIDVEDAGAAGHDSADGQGAWAQKACQAWHVVAYDGLPDFGPQPDLNELLAYLDAVDEYGEAFETLWGSRRFSGVIEAADAFADGYQGTYPDARAWARHYLALLGELPQPEAGFDFDAYAPAAEARGDVQFLPAAGGELHVFWRD